MKQKIKTIAYQGMPGAYSEAAALTYFPNAKTIPCTTFFEAFESTKTGQSELSMIPIENLIAGRVADVHTLLPTSQLYIIAEHFQPITHHLLGLPGSQLSDITQVISHIQGISQCRQFLTQNKIHASVVGDTAGAAQEVAQKGDMSLAAIASARAGELYGLKSLASNIADIPKNMTRFLVLSREQMIPPLSVPCITTLVFTVRSVPAALYKALGGFATNGINLSRIESYLAEANFTSTTFSIDVEGHPQSDAMKHALEELHFFAQNIQFLGTYPQDQRRNSLS